jgi:galactose mutarotase-like enzyme
MLANDFLSVTISPVGAELQSIYHKGHSLEYLWNGDPAFWAKRSPFLFPIVGTLKNDRYFFDGRQYEMSRHGFARGMGFLIEEEAPERIVYLLKNDEETLDQYPFSFECRIIYELDKEQLSCIYEIIHTGAGNMYFSVGGHPAFKVPLVPDTRYSDYYLRFNRTETLSRWPISRDGLIEKQPIPLLNNTDRLNLVKELFYQDALVFKHPASNSVSLLSANTPHGLSFDFTGFPYLGIWAFKDADFLCIEPWCGIADAVDSDQQLIHKEGIISLKDGSHFSRRWQATFF